jgi:hypothetical protein
MCVIIEFADGRCVVVEWFEILILTALAAAALAGWLLALGRAVTRCG